MKRRTISTSLDKLANAGDIERWHYHADHDTFGREAWEIVFTEAWPFDKKKYYTREGIERFLEIRAEPA